MLWSPPFGKDDVKVVYESPQRISSVQFSEDGRLIFMSQTIDNQRQITAVDLNDPKNTYVIYKGGGGGGAEPSTAIVAAFSRATRAT